VEYHVSTGSMSPTSHIRSRRYRTFRSDVPTLALRSDAAPGSASRSHTSVPAVSAPSACNASARSPSRSEPLLARRGRAERRDWYPLALTVGAAEQIRPQLLEGTRPKGNPTGRWPYSSSLERLAEMQDVALFDVQRALRGQANEVSAYTEMALQEGP
jgi:hypothetical protein